MSYSLAQFSESWDKDVNELTYLDYFSFKLIKELDSHIQKNFCSKLDDSSKMFLNAEESIELAFNIGDGLQFFYEKICFGDGCSLGCPNKLNTPFSKREDEMRVEIINSEFNGNFEACMHRKDCLSHDVLQYVVLDNLQDYYNYEKQIILSEKDKGLLSLSELIRQFILDFTASQGVKILKTPTAPAKDLIHQEQNN